MHYSMVKPHCSNVRMIPCQNLFGPTVNLNFRNIIKFAKTFTAQTDIVTKLLSKGTDYL